jgi:hypothetical protein
LSSAERAGFSFSGSHATDSRAISQAFSQDSDRILAAGSDKQEKLSSSLICSGFSNYRVPGPSWVRDREVAAILTLPMDGGS